MQTVIGKMVHLKEGKTINTKAVNFYNIEEARSALAEFLRDLTADGWIVSTFDPDFAIVIKGDEMVCVANTPAELIG